MSEKPEYSTDNGNVGGDKEVNLPCPCGGAATLDAVPDVGDDGRCDRCHRRYRIIEQDGEPAVAWMTVTAPVLVLDLDGTIRYSNKGDGRYIHGPEDVEVYPDVAPVLREFKQNRYFVACASNQGGAAFGHASVEDLHAAVIETSEKLDNMIDILQAAYPHPEGTVDSLAYRTLMRKPQYGMLAVIENIMHQLGFAVDWDHSMIVGDRIEDWEMAEAADVHFEWAWNFFGRAHPSFGRSPRCNHCWFDDIDLERNPVWREDANAWVHLEGENFVRCMDQDWHFREKEVSSE